MTTPAVNLRLLVDRQFVPDCCVGKSYEWQASFRQAVRLWSGDLGRPATSADFSIDALLAFSRHLQHAGYNRQRIQRHRKRLRTLWRYAHRRGLAGPCPEMRTFDRPAAIDLPATDDRLPPPLTLASMLDAPPADSLNWYYLGVFAPQRLIDVDPATVEGYLSALRSVFSHYGHLPLAENTDPLAAAHFAWMKERGKTSWALNNCRKYWFSILRDAEQNGAIDRAPRIRAFKVMRGAPDAWSRAEMKQILAAANAWWRAILLTGYYTLQRRRALFSIPLANVDLAAGVIEFPPTSIKTHNGIRCRIGADAVAAIRAVWPAEGDLLFTWPGGDKKQVYDQFRALIARAGVRPSVRRNGLFHKLRRTGATHCCIRGGGMQVVCDLLAQSGVYVTKLYIDKTQLPGYDTSKLLPLLIDDEHSPLTQGTDDGHENRAAESGQHSGPKFQIHAPDESEREGADGSGRGEAGHDARGARRRA
jgi:hypothetical protein